MRQLDFSLLHKELKGLQIPINGLTGPSDISSEYRATCIPYNEKFLKIIWEEEPTDKQMEKLLTTVEAHLGTSIEPSSVEQAHGELVPVVEKQERDNKFYEFEHEIDNSVVPILNAFLASGVHIVSTHTGGAVYQFPTGGDSKIRLELEEFLKKDLALQDLDSLDIMHSCGGSKSTLNVSQIVEWLIKIGLQHGGKIALDKVNEYLLEPMLTFNEVHCLVGISLDQDFEILPDLWLTTHERLKSYKQSDQIFNPFSGSMPRRSPTALLVLTKKAPKFQFSEPRWRAEKPTYDTGLIILLLTLFGPSAPQHVLTFSETTEVDFQSNGSSWTGSEVVSPVHTEKLKDLDELSKLYEAASRMSDKSKARIINSLSRLRDSMRAFSKAEKALELGIALECIMFAGADDDKTSGEITYRLANRGAWLLGQTFEERKRIFSLLKAAYGLRSSVAHEGIVPPVVKGVFKGKPPVSTSYIVQDSSVICADAIRTILHSGTIPNWTDIVLGLEQNHQGGDDLIDAGV